MKRLKMKVNYITDLIVEVKSDKLFALKRSFAFSVNDRFFSIPKGFETDFSSVPRWFFVYLVAGGKGNKAATIHDWLYTNPTGDITKLFADNVFYECLKMDNDVNNFVAWLMYKAVRIFGKGEFK